MGVEAWGLGFGYASVLFVDDTDGNCSTRFEQRADRRKGLLDGLICGQALAFAGIDNRAHSRKQVASPVGPKAIGDLPKDCTHANGLLAGVGGGWDRSVFQEQEEIVLDCGVAFLQALALRGVRLEAKHRASRRLRSPRYCESVDSANRSRRLCMAKARRSRAFIRGANTVSPASRAN